MRSRRSSASSHGPTLTEAETLALARQRGSHAPDPAQDARRAARRRSSGVNIIDVVSDGGDSDDDAVERTFSGRKKASGADAPPRRQQSNAGGAAVPDANRAHGASKARQLNQKSSGHAPSAMAPPSMAPGSGRLGKPSGSRAQVASRSRSRSGGPPLERDNSAAAPPRMMPHRRSSLTPPRSPHVSGGSSAEHTPSLMFKGTSGVKRKPVARLALGRQDPMVAAIADPHSGRSTAVSSASKLLPPPSAGGFSIADDTPPSSGMVSRGSPAPEPAALGPPSVAAAPTDAATPPPVVTTSSSDAGDAPVAADDIQTKNVAAAEKGDGEEEPAAAPLLPKPASQRRLPPPMPERRLNVTKDADGNIVVKRNPSLKKKKSKAAAAAAAAAAPSAAEAPLAALSARDQAAADARSLVDLQAGSTLDRLQLGSQVRKSHDGVFNQSSSASSLPPRQQLLTRSVSAPAAQQPAPLPLRVSSTAAAAAADGVVHPRPPLTPPLTPTPARSASSTLFGDTPATLGKQGAASPLGGSNSNRSAAKPGALVDSVKPVPAFSAGPAPLPQPSVVVVGATPAASPSKAGATPPPLKTVLDSPEPAPKTRADSRVMPDPPASAKFVGPGTPSTPPASSRRRAAKDVAPAAAVVVAASAPPPEARKSRSVRSAVSEESQSSTAVPAPRGVAAAEVPHRQSVQAPPKPSPPRRSGVEEVHDNGSAPTPLPRVSRPQASPTRQPPPAAAASALGAASPTAHGARRGHAHPSPTAQHPSPQRKKQVRIDAAADRKKSPRSGGGGANGAVVVAAAAAARPADGASAGALELWSPETAAATAAQQQQQPPKKKTVKVFVDAESVGPMERIDIPAGSDATLHVIPARNSARDSVGGPTPRGQHQQITGRAAVPSQLDSGRRQHPSTVDFVGRPLAIEALPHGAGMPPVPAHWQNAPLDSGRIPAAAAGANKTTGANADDRLIAKFMGRGSGLGEAGNGASPRKYQSAISALPAPLQNYNEGAAAANGQQQQERRQQMWQGLNGKPQQPSSSAQQSAPLLSQLHQMGTSTAETRQRVAQWAAPAAGMRVK